MIEAGGGNIRILYADGTSAFFDPEELRKRLEKSFTAARRADGWIAGEIVLAVEYALRGRDGAPEGIAAAEVDDCVVRILEDSGYAGVADCFRSTAAASGDLGKLTPEAVEGYLAEKLQLTGPAGSELAARIRDAMKAIGAVRCPPRLVLELARYFRDCAASPHLPQALPGTVSADGPVLQVHRSDTVFPSIRAEISLLRLFEGSGLNPPLTELAMYPVLVPLAEKLDAACPELNSGTEKYPLILTWNGIREFTEKWLCYDSDISGETLLKRSAAFSACFLSLLKEKPFKVFFR
ncbi:MAG: hypothetical protein IJS14_02185 [Lentisphaeria bacterium]|nr:hypothetical protein [Lentisphaeria bacterium]